MAKRKRTPEEREALRRETERLDEMGREARAILERWLEQYEARKAARAAAQAAAEARRQRRRERLHRLLPFRCAA